MNKKGLSASTDNPLITWASPNTPKMGTVKHHELSFSPV
jgi:hypothetical protein